MTILPERFWAKVRPTDCLIWTGAVNTKGYPCFLVGGVSTLAHRLAYEDAHGPIPDGYTIDHTCRVRNCVNPQHLEAVTIAENNRRARIVGGLRVGGECVNGHELADEAAVYQHPRGHLECRECRRAKAHRKRAPTTPAQPPLPRAG
jgi:hypothetical protein